MPLYIYIYIYMILFFVIYEDRHLDQGFLSLWKANNLLNHKKKSKYFLQIKRQNNNLLKKVKIKKSLNKF